MSNRRLVYIFILFHVGGGSLNPDDRIASLEKELNVLKSQVTYLTSLSQELLKHVRTDIDIPQKMVEEPPTKQRGYEVIVNPTLEERVEKVEQLSKVGTLRSCEEYAAFGIRSSGIYPIDPDGILVGQLPFNVYCSFNESTGEILTEVFHNYSEGIVKVDNCEDPGCYLKNITYISGDHTPGSGTNFFCHNGRVLNGPIAICTVMCQKIRK